MTITITQPWNPPSTIGNTYGAQTVNEDNPIDTGGFSYLTPDALLGYCETKLQSTDSQMESYFTNEQKDAAQQQALSTLETQIASVSGGLNTGNGQSGMALINSFQTAIDDVGPTTAAGVALTQLRDQIADKVDPSGHLKQQLENQGGPQQVATEAANYFAQNPNAHDADFVTHIGGASGGQVYDSTVVQGWTTAAQGIGTNIGNDSQMGMIQLQSLMSDRQTSIQMCTNLVQSLADQAKGIASNIGH